MKLHFLFPGSVYDLWLGTSGLSCCTGLFLLCKSVTVCACTTQHSFILFLWTKAKCSKNVHSTKSSVSEVNGQTFGHFNRLWGSQLKSVSYPRRACSSGSCLFFPTKLLVHMFMCIYFSTVGDRTGRYFLGLHIKSSTITDSYIINTSFRNVPRPYIPSHL